MSFCRQKWGGWLVYLPPLLVYFAAGLSTFTGVTSTFLVKECFGFSTVYLTGIAFWAGIPWVLKMPIGHLVDVYWRWRFAFIVVGGGLIALSLGIIPALLLWPATMAYWATSEVWYAVSMVLGPLGYVVQDAVADALSVEVVERHRTEDRAGAHIQMQAWGRVAIVSGGLLVSLVNVWVFASTSGMSPAELVTLYAQVYGWALLIPVISVLGIALQRIQSGASPSHAMPSLSPDYRVLSASGAFAALVIALGASEWRWAQEVVFLVSLVIILLMMQHLIRHLDQAGRRVFVLSALMIFCFRAVPNTGPAVTWWMIDELGFDQPFMARLGLIGTVLALCGMYGVQRWLARVPLDRLIVILTVALAILSMPVLAMYYGVHHWTADLTGGLIGAREIALIDTALESPLNQIAMIPVLAWIASSAPSGLKATWFAVMASFANLALSFGQLLTRYINSYWVVVRGDYQELAGVLWAHWLIMLLLPLLAVVVVRIVTFRRGEQPKTVI